MISLFFTQFKVDLFQLSKNSSHFGALIGTALTMFLLLRFGVAQNAEASIMPAFLLGALVLALLHGTNQTFNDDAHYDRISQWHCAKLSIEWIVFSRFLAHLLFSGLPLVFCFAAFIWLEAGDLSQAIISAKIMLLCALAVIACGLVSASLATCFNMSSQMAHLLSLPFLFAIMIFASEAMISPNDQAQIWLIAVCGILTPLSCLLCSKLL